MKYLIIFICIVMNTVALAQQVVQQEELIVYGEATDMTNPSGPAYSLNSLLEDAPEVTVNGQGGVGGQHDLSIRGSTFSGAGVSLNGLALHAAQTEHFHSELPIIPSLFLKPEILSGYDQLAHTDGHLVGTVSLQTRPLGGQHNLSIGGGSYESYWARGTLEQVIYTNDNGQLAVGGFGSYDRFNHVNYADNDNQRKMAGGILQWYGDELQAEMLGGYQEKRFGARGYYGVNPDYDAEEELEDLLILASMRVGRETNHVSAALSYRELSDDYKLHLPSFLFHNEHTTKTLSGQVDGHYLLDDPGAGLTWRINGQQEDIESSALGDHHRSRGAFLLLPSWRIKKVTFSAGVKQEVIQHEDDKTLPQAAIDYVLTDQQKVRLSYSESVRLPSYTELNYESLASLGNQGLDIQKSRTINLGWACSTAHYELNADIFSRRTRDTIDWVRSTTESTRWTAENIGMVDTVGAQLGASWIVLDNVQLRSGLTVLDRDNDSALYASRYALDYAEVLAKVAVYWEVLESLSVTASQSYRQQDDNPLRTSSSDQWLGALRLRWKLPSSHNWRLDLTVNNLWDDSFEEFPGQDTSTGRRLYAGVSTTF